jgi:TonB family protein
VWLAKPNGDDVALNYPKGALAKRLNGNATITCLVNAGGLLIDCSVVSEEPAGEGFGAAAVSMAAKFKMRPLTRDGAPVEGGTVRIPLRFQLPTAPTSAAVSTLPSPPQSMSTLSQWEIFARCYSYSAAEAELDPTSPPAQTGAVRYGSLVEFGWAAQHIRPSEAAAKLAALRKEGAVRLRNPATRAERDYCDALLERAGSEFPRMLVGSRAK